MIRFQNSNSNTVASIHENVNKDKIYFSKPGGDNFFQFLSMKFSKGGYFENSKSRKAIHSL